MSRNLIVLGWVAVAAVAVVAGLTAVVLVQGGGLGASSEPLSQEEVRHELDQAEGGENGEGGGDSGPSAEQESAESAPEGLLDELPDTGAGEGEEIFSAEGGSVLARCDGSQARLVWWVPDEGWNVDDVERGPASKVEIEFERGDRDTEFEVVCVDGAPLLED
jgi:hypothetical protein